MVAIKPVWNRRAGQYDVQCVLDANPLYAHEGYLVFDRPASTLACVLEGTLVGSWSQPKKDAVIAWLQLCRIPSDK